MPTSVGVDSAVGEMKRTLISYIEATYHISNIELVRKRRALLETVGTIAQAPYVESTPLFETGTSYFDLGLPDPASEIFRLLTVDEGDLKRQVFDPPYHHQSEAVASALNDDKSLIVTTGTGSGKTEAFLFPILGKLAMEASDHPATFKGDDAVRAIVLYPMNALVNDQLGRIRLLFADPRVVSKFQQWAGRPPRFARYTSRTPYPGSRDGRKDQRRLGFINDYYVRKLEALDDPNLPNSLKDQLRNLINELKLRGKWPAKPDLRDWWGSGLWEDRSTGDPRRCLTLPEDSELITRGEVLDSPPDILITNYSMLEYMLMRPIERPIFDKTLKWLQINPNEKLLLVLDEAHMYHGASGTEVAHLIRRLRTRLELEPERLQVICTSASFNGAEVARRFAGELTGKKESDFVVIEGRSVPLDDNRPGVDSDADLLEKIDLNNLNGIGSGGVSPELENFFQKRSVKASGDLQRDLYDSLRDYGPLLAMKKATMSRATSLDELREIVFPNVSEDRGAAALSVLMELGSRAKSSPKNPSLFPARVHSFFRYLPGIWVCINPACGGESEDSTFGQLYDQPSSTCRDCGSRVFEFFTCRHCGRAYARGYTDNVLDPDYLWTDPGQSLELDVGLGRGKLEPLDMLLEECALDQRSKLESREVDIRTGRLDTNADIEFVREVWIRQDRRQAQSRNLVSGGQMDPCGACGKQARNAESNVISPVQDHVTKGDQPFHSVVVKQISTQSPNPIVEDTAFAPLEGRKVLAFSDSRQAAARLAPNISSYSIQDTLRPLIIKGYEKLRSNPLTSHLVVLNRLYLAAQIGAFELGVRIRPDLTGDETYSDSDFKILFEYLNDSTVSLEDMLSAVESTNDTSCPRTLMAGLMKAAFDPHTGLEACGLAVLEEHRTRSVSEKIKALPNIPGIADTEEEKREIVHDWIRRFTVQRLGIKINGLQPIDYSPLRGRKALVKPHATGRFQAITRTLLGGGGNEQVFVQEWLPVLLDTFTEPKPDGGGYFLSGRNIVFDMNDVDWQICSYCRTPQKKRVGTNICLNCKRPNLFALEPTDDEVFLARTEYYRAQTDEMLKTGALENSMIVAKEHTAQLNQMQQDEAVSLAEKYELLFQDVNHEIGESSRLEYAVDLLSCTTTMEVGIDIGGLSGVALRNMPPSRANYQQRAGRAGRRSDSVATVVSVAGSDSHDIYHYNSPGKMVRGPVEDPILCLDNVVIAKRHITAYLLQRYLISTLEERPTDSDVDVDAIKAANLFSVLGTVEDFKAPDSLLNLHEFQKWLESNFAVLKDSLDEWVPAQLGDDRTALLDGIADWPITTIDEALGYPLQTTDGDSEKPTELEIVDIPDELEADQAVDNIGKESLLDRLFFKGVLPKYAFPTDVASFYVFDQHKSFREKRVSHRYSPSQGTRIALTQYAPGRTVWIDSREWKSGAIYSPIPGEVEGAWNSKELYLECVRCGYARTTEVGSVELGSQQECPACGEADGLGPARYWLHPPGFAHPYHIDENTADDDTPSTTRATRAVLTTEGQVAPADWKTHNDRVKSNALRAQLISTNRGDDNQEGFRFCPECWAIENSSDDALAGPHLSPVPKNPTRCSGVPVEGIALGTRFLTDVLLLRIQVENPLRLSPANTNSTIALKTVCDALSQAGSTVLLDRSTNEIEANFRAALTPEGREGREVEIYLYDTLDGGAGFTKNLSVRLDEVFENALEILEERCSCENSCYDCLRTFGNRFDHETLDRHIGASFLRYMLNGNVEENSYTANRRITNTNILFEDLQRQPVGEFEVLKNQAFSLPAPYNYDFVVPILIRPKTAQKSYAFFLNNTLTPDHIQDETLMDYRNNAPIQDIEIHPIDELLVMKNLPAATRQVLETLGI